MIQPPSKQTRSGFQTCPTVSYENGFQTLGQGEAIGRKREIAQIVRDDGAEWCQPRCGVVSLSLPIRFPAPISVKIAPFAVSAALCQREQWIDASFVRGSANEPQKCSPGMRMR